MNATPPESISMGQAMAMTYDSTLPYPDAEEAAILRDRHQCDTWGKYIVAMAEQAGVSYDRAFALFCALGTGEAFDAFVTYLDDAAEMEGPDD